MDESASRSPAEAGSRLSFPGVFHRLKPVANGESAEADCKFFIRRLTTTALRLRPFGTVCACLLLALVVSAHADDKPPRRIYVPLEHLDVVLERDQRGVILPRAEFDKLWAAAKKVEDNAAAPPMAAVVSSAKYTARVDGDQLVIAAELKFRQFVAGWQQLVLPFRSVTVESAKVDGQPARLGRASSEARPLILFSREVGEHTLTLELSTNLALVGSDRVAAFGIAPVPSATLELELPAGKQLELDGLLLERPKALNQAAKYSVAVGGKRDVALRITDRQEAKHTESLVFAATAIGLHVAPEELTWRAVTTLNVFGRPIDQVQLVVPRALDIVSVASNGLEGWGFAPGNDDTTILTLSYRQAFQEARTITLQGVASNPGGTPWSVPTLRVTKATSHVVRVLVQHPPSLRLQATTTDGVRRVTSDEAPPTDMPTMPDMPTTVDPTLTQYFAAWREEFSLVFVTQPRARELQATVATRLDIDSRELNLRASVAVQTHFAPLFELDLTLPAAWNITDVTVGGQPAKWRIVPLQAGLHQVRVSFSPPVPIDGQTSIALQAQQVPTENWPLEEAPFVMPIPEIHLPQVGVTEGTYMIAADADLELVTEELAGLDPVRLPAEQRQLTRPPRLVYSYQDTRFTGRLKVVRMPARIAAQTVAFHRLDPETLASHLEARLVIEGGGVRKLQVALPEATGTDLRFRIVGDANRITEQTAAAPAAGVRVWTLQLDQRAYGNLWLVVELVRPLGAAGAGVPPSGGTTPAEAGTPAMRRSDISLPSLSVVGVDRTEGFAAIEAGPEQQLAITATDAGGQALIEIAPADLPAPVEYFPKERIVAGYRSVGTGERLAVTETRFARVGVPSAICDRNELTSVLGETGELQHRAEFTFRAVGVQSLRVELPADAILWATLLDGQPVEVRRLDRGSTAPTDDFPSTSYLVPLPVTSDAETSRKLELFYRSRVAALAASGTLQQSPPKLTAIGGSGNAQPFDVLERHWTLHHPSATEITASEGPLEPETPPTRHSLLGVLQQSISVGSRQDLLWKSVWLAVVIGGVGFFTYVARRRGIKGLVLAVVVLGILGVTWALLLPATQQAREAASRTQAKNDLKQHGLVFTDAADSAPAGGGGGFGGMAPPMAATASPVTMPPAAGEGAPMVETASPNDMRGKPAARVSGPESKSVEDGEMSFRRPVRSKSKAQLKSNVAGLQPADRLSVRESAALPAAKDDAKGLDFFAEERGKAGGSDESRLRAAERESELNAQRHIVESDADVGFDAVQRDLRGVRLSRLSGKASGGVLSLALQLDVPAGSRTTKFHQVGAAADAVRGALDVRYQNQESLSFVGLMLVTGVVVLFWFLRNQSARVRAAVGVLGLAVPLALVSLAPVTVLPYLDAWFLGTAAGLALWLILAVVQYPGRIWSAMNRDLAAKPTVTALLLAVCVTGLANTARAEVVGWDQRSAGPPSALPDFSPNGAEFDSPGRSPGVRVPTEVAAPTGRNSLAPTVVSRPVGASHQTSDLFPGLRPGLSNPSPLGLRPEGPLPSFDFHSGTRTTNRFDGLLLAQNDQPQPTPPAATKAVAPAPFVPRDAILIPFDDGTDPLKSDRVFLPYAEFVKLWNAANPNQRVEIPMSVEGFVAESLFAAKLIPAAGKNAARVAVTARFVLHSFVADQITLPLPLGNVAVTKAELDGQPALLTTSGPSVAPVTGPAPQAAKAQVAKPVAVPVASGLAIVLEKPGLHVLDVTFTLPADQSGPAGKFTLPLSSPALRTGVHPVGGVLRFTLPGPDLALKVNGASGAYRVVTTPDPAADPNRKSEIENRKSEPTALIPLDGGGNVTVTWAPKRMQDAVDAIVHVDAATAVMVEDAGLRISSGFQFTVRQGTLPEVSFTLPTGVLLRQIHGADVGGWQIGDGNAAAPDKPRELKVFLRREVRDGTNLVFDLFIPVTLTETSQSINVPQFGPIGVTRETGTVAVFSEKQFAVTSGTVTGLAQIDAGTFQPVVGIQRPQTAPLLAYRYVQRPFLWNLLVSRQRPQSKAVAEHAIHVGLRKLRVSSHFELTLAGAPRSDVVVQLPPRYLLYDLEGPDVADYHVTKADGNADTAPSVLRIELEEPRTGTVELVLNGVVLREPADAEQSLAVPVLLGVNEQRASVGVWLDAIFSGTIAELGGWKSVDPNLLPQRLKGLVPTAVQFAFTSNAAQPVAGQLALRRATPRLTADSLTTVIVQETSIQYVLSLQWQIAQAAESRFVFDTPDWLAGRLDFSGNAGGPRIRQVLSDKIEGNRVRWIVELEEPQRERYFLTAKAVLPPAAGDVAIAAPRIGVEQALADGPAGTFQPLPAREFLVLVNQSGSQLAATAAKAVESVPAADLPIKIQQSLVDQAAEISKVRDEKAVIGWQVRKRQQVKSLAASVNLAELTLVVAKDGSWRGQADYRIQNRARQFLALRLPPGSAVMSLFVADRPSRPVRTKKGTDDVLLVPLPKQAAGDLSVEVKLIFAGRLPASLPRGLKLFRDERSLPAPHVYSQTEDSEHGMPVARTEWTVYLPSDIDAQPVDDPNRMNMTESEAGYDRLVAQLNESLQLWEEYRNSSLPSVSNYDTSRVRMRADNNLKALNPAIMDQQRNFSALNLDANQNQELNELLIRNGRIQQELQIAEQAQAAAQTRGGEMAGQQGGQVDSGVLEQQLQHFNSFGVSADKSGKASGDVDGEALRYRFAVPQKKAVVDSKAGAKPQSSKAVSQKGKASVSNRSELRKTNEGQALDLNFDQSETLAKQQVQLRTNTINAPAQQPTDPAMTSKWGAIAQPPGGGPNAGGQMGGRGFGSGFGRRGSSVSGSGGMPQQPMGNQFEAVLDLRADAGRATLAVTPFFATLEDLSANTAQSVVDGTVQTALGDNTGTRVAGLSLRIELPEAGQKLTFSKIGGDPLLTLGLRPRASLEAGFGLVWCVVWLALGLGLVSTLTRSGVFARLLHHSPLVLIAVGLVWYFLLPVGVLGFALFALGALGFGWQHRKAAA
jgi:hypothetical protein